jgi:uncharacterized protein (TIGR02284 family)
MENAKKIDVLNKLITINNDRIEGYQTASNETEERDLKSLFSEFIATSQKCKHELVSEVTRLGGEVSKGTMTSGKFFRAWMDLKAALTGKDRKVILDSCEFGEDAAKGTYEKVLKEDADQLTTDLQTMIREQHSVLKADHDRVKSMRDSLVHH